MSQYFIVLLICGIFPFILSFYPPLKFYSNIRALIISLISTTLLFGGWDVYATARGHWWFEPTTVCGKYFLGLPIEEWTFFIVIPFCCLFTWETIKYIQSTFFNRKTKK
jgi:lycopene cyclase domain-containing protein